MGGWCVDGAQGAGWQGAGLQGAGWESGSNEVGRGKVALRVHDGSCPGAGLPQGP